MRAITTAAVALLAALALGAPAEARLPWRSCPEAEGPRCTTLRVPLDRSGAVAGQVNLRVARVAFARRRDSHLMYLSGGPGGAGIYEMLDVLFELPELMRRYTVIGFDQRGTGRSGLLRCRELERDGRLRSTEAAEKCAQRLGPTRSFYTTPDTVADMEAIRRAVGAPRLTLFGISYGTELALAYARTYPGRVERLILDSVVDPDESDPFGLAGFRAMGPSLSSLCPDRCRGITSDPGADLTALTARLRAAPLHGSWFDRRGRRRSGPLRPVAIADLLYDVDYDPALRAGVPMAVRAALDNDDAAPMLRLLAAAREFAVPLDPRDFSAARYATMCEETPLPWPRGTAPADRFRVARERALALPGSAFAPFDAEVAYADEIDLCLRWPDPVRPSAAVGGAYPTVPTLMLQGEEDLRTPPEVSAHVATLVGGAQRVTVPGVAHAIIGADPSGCGRRQLLRFVAGEPVRERCARVPTGVPPTGVPPASFAALPPAAGLAGRAGRTVSAIDATLDFLDFAMSPALGLAPRGGGLRGGAFSLRPRLSLRGFVVVPGVRVSGWERRDGTLMLRVRGASAAPGSVRVARSGSLRGRLGGRRVAARLANRPPRPLGLSARVAVASPAPALP
ncbi:MAG TPA: alpha/beta fold hydrolase [Solirubrobacteraceae bacterium]|nr:alpha/beta fold hydrolase [Solirubrobacteraceae bacterium]